MALKLLYSYPLVFPYSKKLSGSELSMPGGAPDKIKKDQCGFSLHQGFTKYVVISRQVKTALHVSRLSSFNLEGSFVFSENAMLNTTNRKLKNEIALTKGGRESQSK